MIEDKILTRDGRELTRYLPTLEEVEEADEENAGFCIACGETAYGVEPDAVMYKCENCGRRMVFGAAELAVRRLVKG